MLEPNHIELEKEKGYEKDFFEDLTKLIDILTRAGYSVLVREDGCDVYVIEYAWDNHKHNDFGDNRFMYVSYEEEESILNERCQTQCNEVE